MQDFERDIMKQFGRGAIDHPAEDAPATQKERSEVCEPAEPIELAVIPATVDAKMCPRCGKVKDRTDFWRNKATKDGLEPYCKECKLAAGRSYAAKKRSTPLTAKAKPATAPPKAVFTIASGRSRNSDRRPSCPTSRILKPRPYFGLTYRTGVISSWLMSYATAAIT